MTGARHWRRSLRQGGVAFFFQAPTGQKMRGSVDPGSHADELQAIFERVYGCQLPEPVIKPTSSGGVS